MENTSNYILIFFQIINAIDFRLLGLMLSNIALVALTIIVTVFVLSVTLLGRAAKFAKEKRSETEQKSKENFDKDIVKLQEQIKKNPSDIDELTKQIVDLNVKREYTVNKIKEIEEKFNALTLGNSVLIPGVLFFVILITENWLTYIVLNNIWQSVLFSAAFISLVFGLKKIILTLQAVQEVAMNTDDYQLEQLKNALIEGLKTVESEKEPKPVIKFKEKPPFVFKPNSEEKIEFEINLIIPGNKEARNIDAWFLFSPEIEIVEDSKYATPFKQNSSFQIPNANTTRYKFDLVRNYTRTSGKIKIKTSTPGNYILRYKVDCDGHAEAATPEREVGIIVQDNPA